MSFDKQVSDASMLLAHAVSVGADVDKRIIEPIRFAERAISQGHDLGAQRTIVELAIRDLSRVMHPVTAETLRSTDGKESEANLWSWKLWWFTGGVLLLVALGELFARLASSMLTIDARTDADPFAETGYMSMAAATFQLALPALYGTLGACAYLLRSCHRTIHERTFDRNRRAEYSSRLLLGSIAGAVAGGIFKQFFTGAAGLEIGAGALGFLAGYNTDFLFTALERLAGAILPKVDPTQIPRLRDRPALVDEPIVLPPPPPQAQQPQPGPNGEASEQKAK